LGVLTDSGESVQCEVLIDSGQSVQCEVLIEWTDFTMWGSDRVDKVYSVRY